MKLSISVLVAAFLLIFNLITPTAILSDGPPPVTQWKGEGTKIKFESIPMVTLQKILNRGSYGETQTISGTLNFPANAPDKNVSAVILLHGGGGISTPQEHWIKTLNSIGLATFMVDSNWARRNCKKDKKNKSFKVGGPYCNGTHRGMLRIVDAYRALELLSKHPRIDSTRIGCLGTSLGGVGCLYQSVKRFQKMWGTPGLDYAASVPMYPPCNVKFNEDDEITDTPIRIHVGDLDTFFPVDSCVNYVERLRAKGKDVEIKVYPGVHHAFDAKVIYHGGKTKKVYKNHNDGRCYYKENQELTEEQSGGPGGTYILTQIGFNEWLASAPEKKKKKLFKWLKKGTKRGIASPQFQFDRSCISKSQTIAYNKEAAEEAAKLIKDFLISTFKL